MKKSFDYILRISVVDGVAKAHRKVEKVEKREKSFVGAMPINIPVWALYHLLKEFGFPVSIQNVKKVAVKQDVGVADGVVIGDSYTLTVFIKDEEMLKHHVIVSVFGKLVGDYFRFKALNEAKKEIFDEQEW